jgi:DNA processing protein
MYTRLAPDAPPLNPAAGGAELALLVALNASEKVGCVLFRRLLERFGSLAGVAAAPEQALATVEGVGGAAASAIRKAFVEKRGERELEEAARHGVRVVAHDDPAFPVPLRVLYDAPLLLYVRGTLAEEDSAAVALVGTREATPYGLGVAERLAADLASQGLTIVSGLARGIDAAAHRGALCRGRTLAVLGSGVLNVYPAEHEPLGRRIAAAGALLSEFPLRAGPSAVHFPRRNRIISGLSLGTVVVESAESSGALITADWAVEQGKEVFAVPGPISSSSSAGCHRLIQQGAKLVTGADDILEEIGMSRFGPPMTDGEARLLEALAAGPRAAADLASEIGLGEQEVEAALASLERRGRAKREGEAYVRA